MNRTTPDVGQCPKCGVELVTEYTEYSGIAVLDYCPECYQSRPIED